MAQVQAPAVDEEAMPVPVQMMPKSVGECHEKSGATKKREGLPISSIVQYLFLTLARNNKIQGKETERKREMCVCV